MYDLTNNDWVRVLRRDGTTGRISLLQALRDADRLHLAYSNPMDRFAVFRFILALGYWCFANTDRPPEPGKPLPAPWISWLEENREYFELYGNGPRFYQDPAARHVRPVTDLLHEIPTGNNFSHFKHSLDYVSGLCLPCCIQGLLRFTVYATSGLPKLKSSINGMPPFYALPWGKTLAETLCLNWEPRDLMGTPAWVDNTVDPRTDPVPLLVGLTALARRSRLHEPVAGDVACAGCGERPGLLVHSCDYQTAGDIANPHWQDPHVCYGGKENKPLKVENLIAEKPLLQDKNWQRPLRESDLTSTRSGGLDVLCIGVAVNQAKIDDVWETTIKIPHGEPGKDTHIVPNWAQANRRLIGAYERHRLSRADKAVAGRLKVPLSEALVSAISPHLVHAAVRLTGGFIPREGEIPDPVKALYRWLLTVISGAYAPEATAADASAASLVRHLRPRLEQPDVQNKETQEDQSD